MDEARRRLQEFGVERPGRLEPSDGNGTFWRTVTTDFGVGNRDDGIWLYQFSHDAMLACRRKNLVISRALCLRTEFLTGYELDQKAGLAVIRSCRTDSGQLFPFVRKPFA